MQLQDPMTESRAIRIATRVPLEAKKLAISLGDVVPLSSTWYLTFSASYSGQVRSLLFSCFGRAAPVADWKGQKIFATSEKFTITDSGTGMWDACLSKRVRGRGRTDERIPSPAVAPGGSYPTITVDHLTPNNDFIATLVRLSLSLRASFLPRVSSFALTDSLVRRTL